MFLILIVQIHSKLTMKNKNNMVSKIKLYILVILTIAMVSCGNKTENPIEKSYNNPDFKMDIVTESEEYFKFKGGKYYVYKNLEKSTGNMSSTISNLFNASISFENFNFIELKTAFNSLVSNPPTGPF